MYSFYSLLYQCHFSSCFHKQVGCYIVNLVNTIMALNIRETYDDEHRLGLGCRGQMNMCLNSQLNLASTGNLGCELRNKHWPRLLGSEPYKP